MVDVLIDTQITYANIHFFPLFQFISSYSCFAGLHLLPYLPCLNLFCWDRTNGVQVGKCVTSAHFFCCPNNRYEVEFRQAILGLICLCPVIIWVVYRKASWAWTLQDSLGIIFSINMLRTVRLPSIKIIALLFTGLFIYDIFFVFITPLMTKVSTSYQILIINLQLKKYETAPYFFY